MNTKTKIDRELEPLEFSRVLDGDREIVEYYQDSTLRIWKNREFQDFSAHWHPAMEIIMPLENYYMVTVNKIEYQLQPGDILIIPSGELHELSAPYSGCRLIFLFDFSIISKIKGFASLLPFLGQPILITKETYPTIYQTEYEIILQIYDEYYKNNRLMEPYIYSLLITFFVHLGRNHMETVMTPPNVHRLKRNDLLDKLDKMFDYLDEHYSEDITLDSIAKVAGFSKFHFTRLFKQCTGQNFFNYLCFKRIKEAESLLSNPDVTITEVALQTGFSSISTFNRTFKKVKNCTPSEYRALYSKRFH